MFLKTQESLFLQHEHVLPLSFIRTNIAIATKTTTTNNMIIEAKFIITPHK